MGALPQRDALLLGNTLPEPVLPELAFVRC
jgi:hypothetical protein